MTEQSPGFARTGARALRAEWTKLRSVRSSSLAILAMIVLTMFLGLLSASLSKSDVNKGVLSVDQFHFVHYPMAGDGSVSVRVTAQADSGAWAKAGIMLKADATSGSPYVALMVTPRHGVLMQADAKTELRKSAATVPRWLRLTRSGQTVTGYESADGTSWRWVGTVTLTDLPTDAQAGLFVGSPPDVHFIRLTRNEFKKYDATLGEATFDHVVVGAAAGRPPTTWRDTDVTPTNPAEPMPPFDGGLPHVPIIAGGSTWQGDDVVTVKGSGDIGMAGMGGIELADMDRVKASLLGVQLGIIGAIALGALYMTSEFKTRTIGTTFAVQPRRGTVLGAKSVVLSGIVFLTGLAVNVAAFLSTQPRQDENGFRPPAYPEPSITDPTVIRAIVGAAAYLALIALFSLAVGAIIRRTAGAVILLLTLLVVIPIVAAGSSDTADGWMRQFTPVAGMSILQTVTFAPGSNDTVTGPWMGFAVLCGYTAVALAGAFWLLRRRDV